MCLYLPFKYWNTFNNAMFKWFWTIFSLGAPVKTQFGNFKRGWISSENTFVAPSSTRKKWNVTKIGRPSDKRTFRCPVRRRRISPQRWKLRCDSFATEHANGQWIHRSREHHKWLVANITWQFAKSLHQNLANGNCRWLGEAGNSNEYILFKTDSPYF